MIYLIQGFFFQDNRWLDLAYVNFNPILVTRGALIRSLYYGAFGPNPENGEELVGVTKDEYGEAELSDIKISENQLSFTKKYNHRDDLIFYAFQKQPNGTWEGKYQGDKVGEGETHCVLTQVTEDFFTPKLDEVEKFPIDGVTME